MQTRRPSRPSNIRIDFRSGGWVILLSLLIVVALVVWRVVPAIQRGRTPYSAALADVPYNGFDLSTCLVPPEQIVSGMPRDTLLPLDNPIAVPAGRIEAINKQYRKYLLPGDRVIGVAIGGQARAYPLRMLNWHEVCNDTLAGEPIAVTYNPLCDSAVVFSRRTGGRELHFGVSGLLYNSNLLMYDTQAASQTASLWSQLRFEAIAGPAAAAVMRLTVLPAQMVYWGDWRQHYPQTTVVAPDPANLDRYNREPYSSYYGRGEPRYPVQSGPALPTVPAFTPVIAVEVAGQGRVYPLPTIAARADVQGQWATTCQGQEVRFTYHEIRPNPPVVWVDVPTGGEAVHFVQSFWFAWHAAHPQDPLATGRP